MKVGRGYQRVVRTAGSITLNSTAWANTSTTLDLTLAASTGDVAGAYPNFTCFTEAVTARFNATCVASGAGFSTRTANTDIGLSAWSVASGAAGVTVGPPAFRTLASADISGGNVIVRLRHKTATAANKSLLATTGAPLIFHARNHGPHVAP